RAAVSNAVMFSVETSRGVSVRFFFYNEANSFGNVFGPQPVVTKLLWSIDLLTQLLQTFQRTCTAKSCCHSFFGCGGKWSIECYDIGQHCGVRLSVRKMKGPTENRADFMVKTRTRGSKRYGG